MTSPHRRRRPRRCDHLNARWVAGRSTYEEVHRGNDALPTDIVTDETEEPGSADEGEVR